MTNQANIDQRLEVVLSVKFGFGSCSMDLSEVSMQIKGIMIGLKLNKSSRTAEASYVFHQGC